ncbi:hypothetical protein RR46_06715 [Papilio xuthus]|uniref:Uncharacterized protein n=1 Tax=Papilio xuthus TaxID=66420 RepID=A0A194PNE9_PAPXU|nr:hypothetical protein RR46_06715 [Papilio xuthus]
MRHPQLYSYLTSATMWSCCDLTAFPLPITVGERESFKPVWFRAKTTISRVTPGSTQVELKLW